MFKISLLRRCLPLALLLLLSFGCSQGMSAETSPAPKTTFSKEEAQELLKNFEPTIKVISVEKSPIDGLWEIVLTVKGEVGLLYVDASKKFVILGSIVDVETRNNLTKAKFEAAEKKFTPRIDFASIPLDDAVVMGDPKAKHKVILFDDPD